MSEKISSMLDDIASRLESKGLLKEASDLDVISNTLDSLSNQEEVPVQEKTTKSE